jgi:hypothetical protein
MILNNGFYSFNHTYYALDPTRISGITLSAGGNAVVTNSTSLFYASGNTCNSLSLAASIADANALNAGRVTTSLTIFFGAALANGTTYAYTIAFANGQHICGNLVAHNVTNIAANPPPSSMEC